MPDPKYYVGEDDRDTLDPIDPPCEVCGAEADEPCTFDCDCEACERRHTKDGAA